MTRRRLSGTHGQATVEFALCLPLVVMLALGVLQIMMLARDQLRVELAAREAVRAAAVSADPGGAARSAAARVVSDPSLSVDTSESAGTVTVRISVRGRSMLPVIGRFVRDIELSARATMMIEPPDDG